MPDHALWEIDVAKSMNRRIQQKAASAIQLYSSFALICFVILGIAGTGYKLLSPDGWIASFISNVWQKGALHMLFVLICVFTVFALVRFWFSDGTITKNRDWIAYLWAGAGLFYCIKLFATGTL